MAKFTLRPGEELDLLTQDEARAVMREFLEAHSGVTIIRATAVGTTDASGNLVLRQIYVVPFGKEFALHRLLVDADGYTWGAPFTNAGGYIDVHRSGERVDGISLAASGTGIPAQSVDGNDQATRFRNGEGITVIISGGPVSRNVQVRIQGALEKYEGGEA